MYTILLQEKEIKEYFDLEVKFNVMLADVNKIIAESSERMLKADIPQIVIDKFWQWGTKRYEYTCSTLSDIHSTGVLKSIVEKEFAALNRYQDHVYFTLIDAENTLENLNGELTGTIYHGKPVESLRHN